MELTPKQIVAELDRYIIGQTEAKRAVAIALRNRYRRSQLSDEIREEITPKNIIMQGPTGVGKTEIARRLAKLVKAPFVKVEATKFTEVGYVGRDVESMIRDLVEVSIRLVKDEKMAEIESKSREVAVKKIVDAITVARKKKLTDVAEDAIRAGVESELAEVLEARPDVVAILDVTEPEPPLENSPFYTLPNCILTPHIAGSKGAEVHRMAEYMKNEYQLYLKGVPCKYEVNLEMLETMA